MFNIYDFINISNTVFFLGTLGIFVVRRNLILVLISIELMLLAVNINFAVFSVYLDDMVGQVFALFVLTIAAAESAIGLAIIIALYRLYGIISIDYVSFLKG